MCRACPHAVAAQRDDPIRGAAHQGYPEKIALTLASQRAGAVSDTGDHTLLCLLAGVLLRLNQPIIQMVNGSARLSTFP